MSNISALELQPITLSIIISALNEGEFLHRTIESIYANTQSKFEIIVVDDTSDDSTEYSNWGNYPRLLFHRNGERLGLIRSRILGSTFARGRYLAFMDAHCNPEHGWEAVLLQASSKCKDRAIIAPVTPTLDSVTWKNHLHLVGQTMTLDQNLDMAWCDTQGLDFDNFCWESPVFAGSCFLISRMFYDELGGLDNGLSPWGGENLDLSFRCWMFGGKVLVVKSSVVGHMFKADFNYSLTYKDITHNKLRVAYINFSYERFQRIWQRLGNINNPPEEAVPHWLTAEKRRTSLINSRCFNDDWYFEKFGILI